MALKKELHDTSHEHRTHRRMQLVYARKTSARQVFMDDLKEYRKRKDKQILKNMIDSIGPKWYQALSVPHRNALDTLKFSIYQDILEGRPTRTKEIVKALGIFPRPDVDDLMDCVYFGRDDPKAMLAHLFQLSYGHQFESKRGSYDLNARLILSAILYLGLENLIVLLRERFKPDKPELPKKPKPKQKSGASLESPYLEKFVARMYDPPKYKRKPPAPLPNLDSLNDPYEEDPPAPKPPALPPPPPPPKKRLPRAYCDKLAGINAIEPYSSPMNIHTKTQPAASVQKIRTIKTVKSEKKIYGVGVSRKKSSGLGRKPPLPRTVLSNSQYTINGVCMVQGKRLYLLGNVTVLPPDGDLIHGGFVVVNGEYLNLHCGFRGLPPPPKPDPCDCLNKWTDAVFQYVKRTKCYCKHHYDFGNEGTFPSDELPLFQKPTRHVPYQFNYHTIFELDTKKLCVDKEFKKVWDTDSMLRTDDGSPGKKAVVKKKKRGSGTCLGANPTPADYLKCALRQMRRANIAARLPDIHLVPELVEWMRRRLYGPYTPHQKAQMLYRSSICWQMFTRYALKCIPHVPVPRDDTYVGHSDWCHKQALNDKYRKFVYRYRLEMFRSHSKFTNLLWPSMFQAQTPDKKFREIYFSYLFGTIADVQVMHPYSTKEASNRYTELLKKPYRCIPAGIEPAE